MDFQVNVPVTVGQMGAYDSGQGGFAAPVTVEIYDLTHNTWVGGASHTTLIAFSAGNNGTLIGGSRFKDLASPVTLPIGTYMIIAANYGQNTEENGNWLANDHFMSFEGQGGKLTLSRNGAYCDYGSTLAVPTSPLGDNAEPEFATGTFALVPEPHEYGLVAVLGLLGLAFRKTRDGKTSRLAFGKSV
jgi:hypothetical protein